MKLKKIYYFNGTHWDREWYKPFQGFRYMLMKVLDEVIEVLEGDPAFHVYRLDGQTAVLDDYIEAAPEARGRLTALVAAGRIAAGPWYTMPDEFLPSGESLIRNLLLGHRKAAEYGAPAAMKYGYVCDIFGHVAQMPQIFAGFGIHGALLQRGCNEETCPPHFLWESPDGTGCITYKVPENFGYGAFYHHVTEPYTQGWDTDRQALLERAIREIDREAARLNAPYLVLNDALDHQRITRAAPWLAEQLSHHYGCPVVFETLDHLVEELLPRRNSLPVMRGELAETNKVAPQSTNILLTYTLSSRYDLKKENDRVQALLEKWAEPMTAIRRFEGLPLRASFHDMAYRYLLRNHAHDSICGCSIDEVHRDMHYRFRQAATIAEEMIADCLRYDISRLEDGEDGGRLVLRVYNPLPFERRETLKLSLDFPQDFPARFSEGERLYEEKNSFVLQDADGAEIPYTLCGMRRHRIAATPTLYEADRADICFDAVLPATGYAEYAVVPVSHRRVRYMGSLSAGCRTLQNPWISLTAALDGTVTLTDRQSGRAYTGLLSYEDDGEIGDGWMHVRPAADRIISGVGTDVVIEKLYDGPAEAALCIRSRLLLPGGVETAGGGLVRSEIYTPVPVCTVLRLGRTNRYVEVETQVDNTAKDHRLRVCLPTDIAGDTYQAGQAFTLVTRTVGANPSTQDWKEPAYGEHNFDGILVKRAADGTGLAFISGGGLHEAAALDDERHSLLVTLFRSFGQTVGTDGQPDGQLQGPLSFRYRLLPLTAEDSAADLVRCRDALQTGVRQYTATLPAAHTPGRETPFMELTGRALAVSAFKLPEDGEEGALIVRLVNYSEETADGELRFRFLLKKAWLCDLLERPEKDIPVCTHSLSVRLAPHKIQTYRLYLGQ